MTGDGDMRDAITRMQATLESQGKQLNRIEQKVDEAWRWSSQHRVGLIIVGAIGGIVISILTIAKGWLFGK